MREPEIKDQWNVEYLLDNELQSQRLSLDLKPKLLGYLRRQLNNEAIDISFSITAHTDNTAAQPYTDSEKWQVLVEKYPALDALRSKFGLDIE